VRLDLDLDLDLDLASIRPDALVQQRDAEDRAVHDIAPRRPARSAHGK
jgi:hypothetical protein